MYNYGNYNPYANQFSPYNQNSIQQLEQMRDQLDARIQTAQQQQQQSQQQQINENSRKRKRALQDGERNA